MTSALGVPSGESSPWGLDRLPLALQMAACTAGVLALELAVIRWMGTQVRLVAYFSNMVLVAAFLGCGLGLALGRRRPDLVHAALPALAIFSAILSFSGELQIQQMRFPDLTIALWGAEASSTVWGFIGATLMVTLFFWMVAGLFLLVASPMGWLFGAMPPLRAYGADLAGSLAGVLVMAVLSALSASPPCWLVLPVLTLLIFSRRPLSLACGLAVIVLAALSIRGAWYSPYNRIDVLPVGMSALPGQPESRRDWRVEANRDAHQDMLNLSDEALRLEPQRSSLRAVYELPFRAHGGNGRVLVVGAGTGNDVMAALRHPYQEVVCVDIDPVIQQLGIERHAENPYADPRAHRVINDARAYFEQHPDERFDVVCYGLLDSHAMFSTMSSLRLDNYVYTLEGVRAGWTHTKPGGVLAISFSSFAGPWIATRMYSTIAEATGHLPLVVPHMMNYGITYIVSDNLERARAETAAGKVLEGFSADPSIGIPTDDWPFLYLRPHTIPYAYIAVLLAIFVTSTLAVRRAFAWAADPGERMRGFDLVMFLMGAAFMLLETRMVTELSLLFGSTWVVNVSVFTGILVMVLIANLIVSRWQPRCVACVYPPLFIMLAIVAFTPAAVLNRLPLTSRALAGGLLYALPVAAAGIIFSTLLGRARNASTALASNLLGAVLGGIVEYSSMAFGLRAMVFIAAVFYGAAMLLTWRGERVASDPPQPDR